MKKSGSRIFTNSNELHEFSHLIFNYNSKRFLATIGRALLFQIILLICSNAAYASTGGVENRDVHTCSAWLRNLAKQKAGAKPPGACAKAADIEFKDTATAPRVKTDNQWIDSDITHIKGVCGACAGSAEKCRAFQRSLHLQEPKKKTICAPGDSLCPYNTCEQALLGLAGALEDASRPNRLPPAPGSEAAAAKRNAAAVLARSVFRQKPEQKRETPAFIKKIGEQFNRVLDKLIRRLFPKPQQAKHRRFGLQLTRGIMFALVVFGLAMLLVFVLSRLRRWFGDEPAAGRGENGAADAPATPARHVSDAEALCARGEYRGAIRALFLAFLRALEQKGHVIFIKNKTNREYLNELRRSNKLNPYMENFTLQYEEAWYGMKACSREDFDRAREAYERSGKGL